jgi:hyperosmotically inducible periplasmic protein
MNRSSDIFGYGLKRRLARPRLLAAARLSSDIKTRESPGCGSRSRFYCIAKGEIKMRSIIKPTISALILSLTLTGLVAVTTGCAGNRYQRSTGDYIDDKALSTRVRTALFRDAEVSGFDVGVNVYRGSVQLNGFVDTPDQRNRAADIVRNVSGVQEVINNLEIKPSEAVGAPGGTVQGTSPRVDQYETAPPRQTAPRTDLP